MQDIKIYNSFSGNKEVFVPINKEHVKIYVCGPTVYNYAHIGNARPAVEPLESAAWLGLPTVSGLHPNKP